MSKRVIVLVASIAVILATAVIVSYRICSGSTINPSEKPSENPKPLSVIAQETQGATPEERAAVAKQVSLRIVATIKDTGTPMTERMAALELAHDVDNPEIVPVLRAAVEDENASIRAAAVSTLAVKDAEDSLSTILQTARDDDVDVRRAVVHALATQDGKNALTALVQFLDDEDSLVRKVASNVLTQKTNQDFGYQYYASREKRKISIERWKAWLEGNGGGR